jgi:hypothetical protein
MALQYVNYVEGNFPIETDFCISVYKIIFDCMYDQSTGSQKSKLYGVKSFYIPKPEEVVPVLFGTLFNGSDHAEVLFSIAQKDEFGKLEISLCGNDIERLKGIQHNMGIEIKKQLNSRKK